MTVQAWPVIGKSNNVDFRNARENVPKVTTERQSLTVPITEAHPLRAPRLERVTSLLGMADTIFMSVIVALVSAMYEIHSQAKAG